jgi:stringent starvation protein B
MSNATTKPYLLRALYEWCVDQGYTPYIAVVVDERTVVPPQYVKDGQIVLNIGPEAVHQLAMGNDAITCSARFGGVAQALSFPVDMVAAIYARENGHGMAFEVSVGNPAGQAEAPAATPESKSEPESAPAGGGRTHLRRIK